MRGEKARIRREAKLSGSQLDNYISMTQVPGIDQLDKIASALGVAPWDLINPESEVPDESLRKIISNWTALNENQQRILVNTALAFISGKVSDQPVKPVRDNKKTSS